MRKRTRYVHAGSEPDPETGAVVPPIHTSTTFAQDGPGEHRGFEYSRTDNPTRSRLEDAIADLEGATGAAAYASGMAACTALCHLLESGDKLVCEEDCYGGTRRYLTNNLASFDVDVEFADLSEAKATEQAVTDDIDLVIAETPTNPLLKIVDVHRVAEAAQEAGALCCIDNTFASPHLQNPLEMGADIVWHSATKYLGGHSDVVGGALAWSDDELTERVHFDQNSMGPVPSPFDCYQLLRGIKTLGLRMDQHCENARAIAEHLADHDDVDRVLWPGFDEHPNHGVAKRQMHDYGGMVSVEVPNGLEGARAFFDALEVFVCAESLGAVESLANHPAEMTHASVPADVRRELGITDGLVRLSVGIEDSEDLIEAIDRGLDAAASV
jgi:cystathionine gamma-lyase